MERKLHLLESFNARGADGASYKVFGYEHLARDGAIVDGQDHWEPTGVCEYRLADGGRVDMRRDGSMCVAATGLELSALDSVPA